MDSQVNIVIAGSVVRALRDHEKGKHGQPSHYYDCRKCSESIKRPREVNMDSQVNIVIAGSVVRALRDHEKGKHGQPSQHYDCRKCSESIERPREG